MLLDQELPLAYTCVTIRRHAIEHYRVQIAPNGRMVLPISLRQQLQVEGGGLLIIRRDEDRLVLESVNDAVRRAQALVRQYAPEAAGVTDEFLAERQAEAMRE
jgi:bifunctional DNA-binding transcriptional regulator/antitoxin component of YhaV-PrlF toxin-antitoxin module